MVRHSAGAIFCALDPPDFNLSKFGNATCVYVCVPRYLNGNGQKRALSPAQKKSILAGKGRENILPVPTCSQFSIYGNCAYVCCGWRRNFKVEKKVSSVSFLVRRALKEIIFDLHTKQRARTHPPFPPPFFDLFFASTTPQFEHPSEQKIGRWSNPSQKCNHKNFSQT